MADPRVLVDEGYYILDDRYGKRHIAQWEADGASWYFCGSEDNWPNVGYTVVCQIHIDNLDDPLE